MYLHSKSICISYYSTWNKASPLPKCLCPKILNISSKMVMLGTNSITDYGRPMKPFFIEILNFWAWADKLGR